MSRRPLRPESLRFSKGLQAILAARRNQPTGNTVTLPNFGQILRALDRFTRHEQVVLSALAVMIGGIGGGSAIAFR